MIAQQDIFGLKNATWQQRLDYVVDMMREMSTQTDPQAMVESYVKRVQHLLPATRRISLSRRNLEYPYVRITRFSDWNERVNPWEFPERLPVIRGGLFADLIYANEPRLIDELSVGGDDPAAAYLDGQRSLLAVPLYDQGESLNMVIIAQDQPGAFDRERIPEWVWMSNLFGRATLTLVLSDKLKNAYESLDRELQAVGKIQRALLPASLPRIPTLDLAAYYQTSARAGGDYYDVFPLTDGTYGLMIADVSGHGTPAAVIMALTHGLGHAFPGDPTPPSALLGYINRQLCAQYTTRFGAFVTAFYGVYCPKTRTLRYASAGHNPPRLKRCADGSVAALDGAQSLPMGITEEATYTESEHTFVPGDQIVFYTDGITEAMDPQGVMFGTERLDQALACCRLTADGLIDAVIEAVHGFSDGQPQEDDRTMIVAKVS